MSLLWRYRRWYEADNNVTAVLHSRDAIMAENTPSF